MTDDILTNDVYKICAFAKPFYDPKDAMHDWSHIRRCYAAALSIISENKLKYDAEILTGGLMMHGLIYDKDMEDQSGQYMKSQGAGAGRVSAIIRTAWDSQKEAGSETLEGGILHDAHLLEGDENFIVTKVLVTGTARGQKLHETVQYFFDHVLNANPPFYLPSTKERYQNRLQIATDFFSSLRVHVTE